MGLADRVAAAEAVREVGAGVVVASPVAVDLVVETAAAEAAVALVAAAEATVDLVAVPGVEEGQADEVGAEALKVEARRPEMDRWAGSSAIAAGAATIRFEPNSSTPGATPCWMRVRFR